MKPVFTAIFVIAAFTATALNSAPGDTNKTDPEGKKQGLWKEVTGGLEWYGNYSNNRKTGTWINYHPGTNPPLAGKIETWIDGKKNGIYMESDRNGYIITQRFYKNDSLDGTSVDFAVGAKPKTELTYRSGKINGIKRIYNLENFKVQEEGNYVNNLREGVTKWYFMEGKVSIEYNYKHGMLDGKMKTYYLNGNIASEGTYLNNELEGEYVEYYEKGKPKNIGNYKKGKKEGHWKEYTEDGKLKTLRYKNDQLLK